MLAKVSFDSDEPLFVNRLVCMVMVLLSRLDSKTNSAVLPTGPTTYLLIAHPACDCIARGGKQGASDAQCGVDFSMYLQLSQLYESCLFDTESLALRTVAVLKARAQRVKKSRFKNQENFLLLVYKNISLKSCACQGFYLTLKCFLSIFKWST
jgi:hypothetical protein